VLDLEQHWEQEGNAYGNFNPLSRDAYASFLERSPAYCLVAACDGQLVGYVHASVRRDQPVEVIPAQIPHVEIENISVRPDDRDRGIADTLLEQVFAVAQHEHIERFVVGTPPQCATSTSGRRCPSLNSSRPQTWSAAQCGHGLS
jgi:ribosomal protein S18 acetylase RimI-like enzyme